MLSRGLDSTLLAIPVTLTIPITITATITITITSSVSVLRPFDGSE